MIFKRKVYPRLLEWKQNYADQYAVLLEGARRVGKCILRRLADIDAFQSGRPAEQNGHPLKRSLCIN